LSLCLALARILKEYRLRSIAIAHYDRERAREAWEMESFPEGEKSEMIELYHAKGLTMENATKAVEALATDHSFFTDLMMSQELEMIEPERPALGIAVIAGAAYLGSSLIVMLLALAGSLTLHFFLTAVAGGMPPAVPQLFRQVVGAIFPTLVKGVTAILPVVYVPFSFKAEVLFSSYLVFFLQRVTNSDAASSAVKLLPLMGLRPDTAPESLTAVYTHRAGILLVSSLLAGFFLVFWLGIAYLLRSAGDQLPSLRARRGTPRGAHARIFAGQIALCAVVCAVLTSWVFLPAFSQTMAMALKAE
jgi:VIT family